MGYVGLGVAIGVIVGAFFGVFIMELFYNFSDKQDRTIKILRQITDREDMIEFLQADKDDNEKIINEIIEKYHINNKN